MAVQRPAIAFFSLSTGWNLTRSPIHIARRTQKLPIHTWSSFTFDCDCSITASCVLSLRLSRMQDAKMDQSHSTGTDQFLCTANYVNEAEDYRIRIGVLTGMEVQFPFFFIDYMLKFEITKDDRFLAVRNSSRGIANISSRVCASDLVASR